MFPTLNAFSVSRLVAKTGISTATGFGNRLSTGQFNLFSVPGVVDVSGMEFSMGVAYDSTGNTPGLVASTNSASSTTVTFSDGGPTGDATAAHSLFTAISATTAWTTHVPRDVTGTSATDLDADDWVNFRVTVESTTVSGANAFDLAVAYVYGKPGSIA
jgi:hypothetical protein